MKKNTKIKSRSMFYFSVLYRILLAVQRKKSIFSNTSRDIKVITQDVLTSFFFHVFYILREI